MLGRYILNLILVLLVDEDYQHHPHEAHDPDLNAHRNKDKFCISAHGTSC